MKAIFEKLKAERGGKLREKRSKWNTGNGVFPLYIYDLDYKYESWDIKIKGENRAWKFSSDSTNFFSTYSRDSNIWSVQLKNDSITWLDEFIIYKRPWLYKIITGEDYFFKSKNHNVKSFLRNNPIIQGAMKESHLYQVEGKCRKEIFVISMSFSTITDHEKRIRAAISLGETICREINGAENVPIP